MSEEWREKKTVFEERGTIPFPPHRKGKRLSEGCRLLVGYLVWLTEDIGRRVNWLIKCRVFPLVSGSISFRQFPIGPSFGEIGQVILGAILDIVQAIQECPDSDSRACHHFRYAETLFLRTNDGFLPGCVHQRETPFRGDVDFSLSGLFGGNRNTVTYGLHPSTDTLFPLSHKAPPQSRSDKPLNATFLREGIQGVEPYVWLFWNK